jgi:hypothetical protein
MSSFGTETVSTAGNTLIEIFGWNRGIVERAVRTTQEESLSFIQRRLESNRRALEKMKNAHGLDGLLRAQQEWFVESTRDYFEQTERFGGKMLDVADKSSRGGAEETRRATEAVRGAVQRDSEKARESFRSASPSVTKTTPTPSSSSTPSSSTSS